jgi:hypothetical protein
VKSQTTLATKDVLRTFSDDSVRLMASAAKLHILDGKLPIFAKAIRKLARAFIRDANAPNADDVGRQIKALHAAADQHQFKKAADLVKRMSNQTRKFLNKRAVRIGLTIPRPSFFQDRARRQAACKTLRRITSQGGHREDDKCVAHLYLPRRHLEREELVRDLVRPILKDAEEHGVEIDVEALRRKAARYVVREMVKAAEKGGVGLELRSPKRKAELNFIMNVQLAYDEVTDRQAPIAARKYEKTKTGRTTSLSPLAVMLQKSLVLLGAEKADAVGLINELRRRALAKGAEPRMKKSKRHIPTSQNAVIRGISSLLFFSKS